MKKELKVIFIILLTSITLLGCNLIGGDDKDTSSSNGSDCFAKGKQLVSSSNVEARIVSYTDSSNVSTQSTFSLDDLLDLQFGVNSKNLDEAYYVAYELCDSDDKYVVEANPVKEDYTLVSEPYAGASESFSGSYTSFYYGDEDGVMTPYIDKSGKYNLNVFVASKGGDWEWVDSKSFEVK